MKENILKKYYIILFLLPYLLFPTILSLNIKYYYYLFNIKSFIGIFFLGYILRYLLNKGNILPLKFQKSESLFYKYHYFRNLTKIYTIIPVFFSSLIFFIIMQYYKNPEKIGPLYSYVYKGLYLSIVLYLYNLFYECKSVIQLNENRRWLSKHWLRSFNLITLVFFIQFIYSLFLLYCFMFSGNSINEFIINILQLYKNNIMEISLKYIINFKFLIMLLFSYISSLILIFLLFKKFKVGKDIWLRTISINLLLFSGLFVITENITLLYTSQNITSFALASISISQLIIFNIIISKIFEMISRKTGYLDKYLDVPPSKYTSNKYLSYALLIISIIGFVFSISGFLSVIKSLFLSIVLFLIAIYFIRRQIILENIVAERTVDLRKEKLKVENLLNNILPKHVISELKEIGESPPRNFTKVAVLFSDFAGFTKMSSSIEPSLLINELNDIFTNFDKIAEKHETERIKTIGDAYLAVCGMHYSFDDCEKRMLETAIEMISYINERNNRKEIHWFPRIGIHVGQIVGGIVGTKKYVYDIFGDTVNTASRMESNSEPMKINVSENIYTVLKDKYSFQKRKPIEVKGKGNLNMYFLNTDNF